MGLSKSCTDDFFNFSNPHYSSDEEEEDGDDHSCDFNFHPFRSLGASQSHPSTLNNCGLMDHNESVKVTHGKVGTFCDGALISEIERTMKELSDNLLYAMEGLSARVSQLEGKTHQFENSVDDLKFSAEYNYGRTDGKLRQLENILLEVKDGVQFLREKQEIAETQLQLAKLQASKGNSKSADLRSALRTDSVQQASESASQQPLSVSGAFPLVHPTLPLNASSTLPYQNLPQNQIPSPLSVSYYPTAGQTPEISVQQYQLPLSYQSQPPPHQIYQPSPQLPHVSQSTELPQLHFPIDAVTPQNRPLLSHHREETPYFPSYSYLPSIPQSSQPAGAPPTQDSYAGSTQHMHGQFSRSPNSEFLIENSPGSANFGEMHTYSGSPSRYSNSTIEPLPLFPLPSLAVGGSNYTRLPKAQILPHALPTASSVHDGLGSEGTGNRAPEDDVVEKVTAMGFRRDIVKGTVRKLTNNGQSVDLNAVLDKLMNNGA